LRDIVDVKADADIVNEEDVDAEDSKIDDLLGAASVDSTGTNNTTGNGPLLDLWRGMGYQGGPVIGRFEIKHKEIVLDYLNRPQVRALLPAEQRYVKFVFGKPEANSELVDLYALVG